MKRIVILLAFFIGFLFCIRYKHNDLVEGFQDSENFSCPNVLFKKGKELYLLNKRKAIVPGRNPIRFDNLEQYGQYLKWQRRVGIRCPVLYFEEGYDAQNKPMWRYASDPFDPQPGNPPNDVMRGAGDLQVGKLLDANVDTNPPANSGGYAAYDPDNQNIGRYTPLDKMFHAKGEFSKNPMDPNWIGRGYPPGGETVNRLQRV